MRLLHVGDDFAGLRPCGLTLYVEALMQAQAEQGHEVAYVFSGRHYPRLEGPRLKRWNSGRVKMFELIGSPSHAHWDGTRDPARDLAEPAGEATFAAAIRAVRPEVVHIHELSRLPSSLIEHAKAAGLPVVMTLHDYKPLCASVRLLDADGERCMRRNVGEDCARNCAAVPTGRAHLIDRTLGYELGRLKRAMPLARHVNFSSTAPLVAHASSRLHRSTARQTLAVTGSAPAADYQRRRDVNAERLGLCDRLIAPSRRVAEIYAALGVDRTRLCVQRLTLPHLGGLRPSGPPAVGIPMNFATLGGCASTAKGARAVVDAALALERGGHGSQYRLVVHGLVDDEARAQLTPVPSVRIAGPYDPGDLDSLLDDADVGILPSVWEEAHGFAGVEMLARGLPVIGTAFGGIPEYVREGETGWLNHSGSGSELAKLMLAAISDRDEVLRLQRSVRALNDEFARPMYEHVDEVQSLYAELISETTSR